MIDFYIDTSNVCWGVVESYIGDTITIPSSEWAPGIWAGVSDCWVSIKDPLTNKTKDVFMVYSVDLDKRTLFVGVGLQYISPGDLIYYAESNK
jgi:hypothetical protein